MTENEAIELLKNNYPKTRKMVDRRLQGGFTGVELANIAAMQIKLKEYEAIGTPEEYPTAYDVDKVVEQLEDRKSLMLETLKISEADIDRGRIYGMDKAIEIVKAGGADGN